MIRKHDVPVTIVVSDTPVPLHFALPQGMDGNINHDIVSQTSLREVFDVPELSNVNDNVVDSLYDRNGEKALPLAPFTTQGVDNFFGAFGALYGDPLRAFSKLCFTHQLPVLPLCLRKLSA